MPRSTLGFAVAFAAALASSQAAGRISPADYRDVGISLPAGAAAPLEAVVADEAGRPRPLRALVTAPTVLVFADYTCRTLCGPVLDFVATALEQSGLDAGQYRLLVIGLDPKDSAADAEAMRRSSLADAPMPDRAARFVTADAATVARLTSALGYRFRYDAAEDAYAHPAAAYVLTADGKVSRVLSGLGLNGGDLRLALVEAGRGTVGNFADQVHLICYGFDPASGTYNLAVGRLLSATGVISMLGLGGLIGALTLSGRRRRA